MENRIKLYIAQLINEENDNYAKQVSDLKILNLSKANELIEILTFSHKEKLKLLEKIYDEV